MNDCNTRAPEAVESVGSFYDTSRTGDHNVGVCTIIVAEFRTGEVFTDIVLVPTYQQVALRGLVVDELGSIDIEVGNPAAVVAQVDRHANSGSVVNCCGAARSLNNTAGGSDLRASSGACN